MTEAIPQWQNGAVAIGARQLNGNTSRLVGSGWIIDLPLGLVCTCGHVVMDCFPHPDSPTNLDANMHGVAIGVGVGETIRWYCRANVLHLSLPSTDVGYPGTREAAVTLPANNNQRLDFAVLRLCNMDGTVPLMPPLNDPTAALWHWPGQSAIALPICPDTSSIPIGAELVLLGYGQGREMGDLSLFECTSTTDVGTFRGRHTTATTGDWLESSLTIFRCALILSPQPPDYLHHCLT